VRRTAFALVLAAGFAALPASASASTYNFRVLSATQSYSTTASRGCTSGRRDFSGSLTGTVPDDPANTFTQGQGEIGSIGTRSSSSHTSPTSGQFSNDYVDNPCSSPPCHYDYGVTPVNGGTISMTIFDTGDPATVRISPSFGPPGVGDVTNGACGGPIDVRFPFGEPSATIASAPLFSGQPTTLTVSGAKDFSQDNLGQPASVTVTYNISMRVQAIGEDLHITTAAATGEDQGGPSGKWTPSLPIDYADRGCQTPAEDTPTPLAYVIAGSQRNALTSLLGTKEESLAGAAGFAGRNLKLKRGMSAITPATVGANGARWQAVIDAAHTPKPGVLPGRGVFYGARIACKLMSAPANYTAVKSGVFTLCHNQSSLSGSAWTGLVPEMRAALARLWKILGPLHACFTPNSGFRSQDQQDALRDKWHGIADQGAGDTRSDTAIHDALKAAGFAQDPNGHTKSGVAKGGPALFSLHTLGIAADVHVEFSDTGVFAEDVAKLRAAAAQAGLCGPPGNDPVHVELPFIAGKDPKTGYPTLDSATTKNGVTPKCSSFTDVPTPKPAVKAAKQQNPLNGLSVSAGANIGGTATASATTSTPGAQRVFRFKAVTRRFKAGRSVKLKLKLPRNARGPIAAALKRGLVLKAKVRIVVDYGGASKRKTLTIRLRR
jgi:hypothetical protein